MRALRIALEIAVVVVFAILLKQNWQFRHIKANLPRPTSFEAKETLPSLNVIGADGKKGIFDPGPGRNLLLIGDPRCGSCEHVLQQMPADHSMVLSIANPETTRSSKFASVYHGPIYSLTEPPRDARLHHVPQILLVESQRVVRTCADVRDCR